MVKRYTKRLHTSSADVCEVRRAKKKKKKRRGGEKSINKQNHGTLIIFRRIIETNVDLNALKWLKRPDTVPSAVGSSSVRWDTGPSSFLKKIK